MITNQRRGLVQKALANIFNPESDYKESDLARNVAHKNILVTGASSGIGAACAQMLGQVGGKVFLLARNKDKLEEQAKQIKAHSGEAYIYATDLSSLDAVEKTTKKILAEHGPVDILVNNAGKSIRRSVSLSLDRFQDYTRTIDINYTGPTRLIMSLLPAMREQESGHIINISTIGVRIPAAARWGAYQASKGAYDILLRSLDQEMRHEGIYTTSIYMPLVYTDMSAPTPIFKNMPGLYPEEAAALVAKAIIEKPKEIEPWWVHPTEMLTTIFRQPTDFLLGALYPLTEDTESAKAFKQKDVTTP